MVRVATLRKRQRAGLEQVSPDGLTVSQQLAAIRDRAVQMMRDQASCWQDRLRPALAEAGVTFLDEDQYTDRDPAASGRLLQERRLSAADAAGVRSRPSVSATSRTAARTSRWWSATTGGRSSRASRFPTSCRDSCRCRPAEGPTFAFLEDVIRLNLQAAVSRSRRRSTRTSSGSSATPTWRCRKTPPATCSSRSIRA